MADALEFILNGRPIRATDCSPNTTLLEYLRNKGLTGSKEGCAEGDCGACSVAIVDTDSQGKARYRAINSCLVPLCLLAGREIVSVEGVGCSVDSCDKNRTPRLHPVQKEMVECHGSQCGYCTPGFIMSLFEGYYRDDLRSLAAFEEQICGNLCRCTGYRSIREAGANAFAEKGEDAFSKRLEDSGGEPGALEYRHRSEAFYRPLTLFELLKLREKLPEARLIAGATELGLEITKRYKRFATLISVEAVRELRGIEISETEYRIGAAATLTQIEESLGASLPALGDMLRVFGSRQIRNRATMGGNIVTASPIGDGALVLLALDAEVSLASLNHAPNGNNGDGYVVVERRLAVSEFFLEYRKTALAQNEILKTIIIPRKKAVGCGAQHCRWYKVSKRREMDISTVAACFRIDLDAGGKVLNARLAYGGVAALSLRAKKTEQALVGKSWSEETVSAALPILREEFTPISDVRGDAAYRQGLIQSLFEKFLHDTQSTSERAPNAPLSSFKTIASEIRRPMHDASPSGSRSRTASASIHNPQGKPEPHESGHKHVTGEAKYTDDLVIGKTMLEVWPVTSPHAKARILNRDATDARKMPGIHAVLMAEDVPGLNDVGTKNDEVLFPKLAVSFHGQIVALVVGETMELCRAAAEKVKVEYQPEEPVLDIHRAIAKDSFHNVPNFIRRGDCDDALGRAPRKLTGTFELGGQEHFYLETQAALAEPGEDGSVFVMSSTQHPSEVQMVVSHMLHVPANKVIVQCPRMGGGFGGKETQAALPAALAALAASQTGRAVRVRFNRDQDMMITGHRHPFLAQFEIGFDADGVLRAAKIGLISDGGWSLDLSQAVTDRALFHLDNSYYIPAVEFSGRVAKTNLSSNTAFRGFGGPQGMLVIEEILDRVARDCGLRPEVVRERNLYRGKGQANTTHYGQEIENNRIQTIWHELKKSSELEARRDKIAKWNLAHPNRKRGIAITPVKFGISFTVTHLNQAGALVLIYHDGTIQVNHGGTEMGQGLHTNIRAIVCSELGVRPDRVRLMPTSTDKIPNTSATAASCGTDLNGAATQNACEHLLARLRPFAAKLIESKFPVKVDVGAIQFQNSNVFSAERPDAAITFKELIGKAYTERISLSANGFYATPGIHWDRNAGRGKPFHYFACGAAVAEVEVDRFTGMHRMLRVDILHDVGDSINAGINRGQVEGGFIQGMGWLTTEELKWDKQGRLLTHSPDTYKFPSIGDTPPIFNVELLPNAAQEGVVRGSKAVGEPPLMLAISVREAIRDAVAAFGPEPKQVRLGSPATCEAIYDAIRDVEKTVPDRAGGFQYAVSGIS
jgi:xanthine dehydrogenase molybdopterin binding subunit/xanthine dehydrogenase small subunit